MKIVVPDCVEVIAAFGAWPNQFGFLPLVFRDQNDGASTGRIARGPADSADDVLIRVFKDSLRSIEAESVEVELFDPIATIGDEKFADRSRICSIEINRVAPIVFFFTSQIIVGINPEIISVRAEGV